jgi:hypothetical protein
MRGPSALELVPTGLCAIAAGAIYRQSLGIAQEGGWRRHAAASIPAVYTFFLGLVWVIPIQLFLAATLDTQSQFPVIVLTILGVVLGACLPAAYFRLRRAEADGRTYAALGVRRFRSFVTYGDPMVRLMRRINPASHARLTSSTLAERERRAKRGEKIHWALLLGSVPAAVWAILVQQPWFAAYLLAANVPMNVYPILLQRYTRSRLARIRARASLSRAICERSRK